MSNTATIDLQLMPLIREWLAMPIEQAKPAMRAYMDTDGGYSTLDYGLLDCSESVSEAIGVVFGI